VNVFQSARKLNPRRGRESLLAYGLLVVLAIGVLGTTVTLLGCSKEPGSIGGTITQDPDGAPVPDAQIVVFELIRLEKIKNVPTFERGVILYRANTDENGEYSITVEPGEYVIEVWAPPRATKGRQIEVKGGRTLVADFRLAAPSP
jgi:hypothetical protein